MRLVREVIHARRKEAFVLKSPGGYLGMVFGVALLFALVAGGYLLFKYITGVFATLDPQMESLATIASIVALLCAAILAEGVKARPHDNSIEMDDRIKVYECMLALSCQRATRRTDQRPALSELAGMEQSLALRGAARVVSAYIELRAQAKRDLTNDDAAVALLRKLLTQMRADLARPPLPGNENEILEMLLDWYRDGTSAPLKQG